MAKKIFRSIGLIVSTVIITASIVGAGLYGWHIGEIRSLENAYKDQIHTLELQVKELTASLSTLATDSYNKVSYENEDHGFRFEHSSDYTVSEEKLEEETGTYINVDVMDGDESIFGVSTFSTDMEGFITQYLIEGSRTDTVVSGKVGYSYKVESMKDGSEIPEILVYDDDRIFVFYGEGEEFEEILTSFEFL
ncbi:hypothetical protein GF354_01350 [Candidatus Peregrinibacteria bacterium]|nr:hypothetical protein [Candidatus Peregrinibacteria bacterium]